MEGDDSTKVISDACTTVQEGQASVLFPSIDKVFYNPVQEFNRDLSIAVLRLMAKRLGHAFKEKDSLKDCGGWPAVQEDEENDVEPEDILVVLEGLAASGLRSIRYAKEVCGLKSVVANDFSRAAVESIRRNVVHNGVESKVTPSESDAALLMYQHRRPEDRFHAVDVDPYGSPAQFLDGAVQAVKDGGILMVTCTDMAVLAGNAPETCYVKYGATSLKSKSCHELALRIVLQCLESHANRYGRYIRPLLSLSVDFYVRLFVQVFSSQAKCKETTSKLAMVYQCVGCETMSLQSLGKTQRSGSSLKYTLDYGPPVGSLCEHCQHRHHLGGPIWTGPLHDMEFVSQLLDNLENNWEGDFKTEARMRGILSVVLEELEDVPLYFVIERLSSLMKMKTMSMVQFRSAILNAGYRISLSHACRTSAKTDAPARFIWDILRAWEKENPVRRDKLTSGSVPFNLLASGTVEPTVPLPPVSFELHPEANPESRERKLKRFQQNPERNWGPGSKSKASFVHQHTVEKRVKNQGKRSRSNEENGNRATKKNKLKSDVMTL